MDFLEYCEIGKNQSRNTIAAYHRYLNKFERFARELGLKDPKEIKLETVNKYRLYLNRLTDATGHNLKLVTQNYHLIALRAFLKYLTKQDIKTLAPEKIELPKTPPRQVEFLSTDELQRLFDATRKEQEEIIRLRDYAILQTLFSTGLRVSELSSLKRDTINLKRKEFTVRGKGGKLRLVFLSDEAAQAIEKYFSKRDDNNKAVFISHFRISRSAPPLPSSGEPKAERLDTVSKQINSSAITGKDKFRGIKQQKNIEREIESFGKDNEIKRKITGLTPRSIQRIIKKYALLAGIAKPVTPHTLRHSFATDLLRNGADIRSVQTLLGHASITTTQIYTHITDQGLRDVYRKYHNRK